VLQQTEEVLREQDPTYTAPRSDAAAGAEVGHQAHVSQLQCILCTMIVQGTACTSAWNGIQSLCATCDLNSPKLLLQPDAWVLPFVLF
jgi:hypothetical protein